MLLHPCIVRPSKFLKEAVQLEEDESYHDEATDDASDFPSSEDDEDVEAEHPADPRQDSVQATRQIGGDDVRGQEHADSDLVFEKSAHNGSVFVYELQTTKRSSEAPIRMRSMMNVSYSRGARRRLKWQRGSASWSNASKDMGGVGESERDRSGGMGDGAVVLPVQRAAAVSRGVLEGEGVGSVAEGQPSLERHR